MLDEESGNSEDSDQEEYEEVKSFKELNSEEIDEVAARFRKISPKFKDLIRPDVIDTKRWLEYKQEVERIANCRENFYAVMPPREKKQVILSTRPDSPVTPNRSINR